MKRDREQYPDEFRDALLAGVFAITIFVLQAPGHLWGNTPNRYSCFS